jgi:uncharacterized protein (DUF305 family)
MVNKRRGCVVSRKRTAVTGVAVLAAAAVMGACGNSATEQAAPSPVQTSTAAVAAAHNQSDVTFAQQMIPHHRQAIEMSDMILAKPDIDPRVVDLAKQIKAAQGPEIEQMQGWLSQWGAPDMPAMNGAGAPQHGPGDMTTTTMPHGPGMPGMPGMPHDPGMPGMPGMPHDPGMPGMAGMMSPADMQGLRDAQGVAASGLFLGQMIEHHQGAITMAQDEIKNGQYPDAITLANAITTGQQTEIDTMNQILNSL